MGSFHHLNACMEMTEKDVLDGLVSREDCKDLLARFAEIATPDSGAPRLLFLFARMATTACDWIDGDLRVDIKTEGERTVCDVTSELAGFRERVLPPITIHAPLREFASAVERFPTMISPLTMKKKSWKRIVLVASEDTRKTTMPPPMVEIGEESLVRMPCEPLPPHVSERAPAAPPATAPASRQAAEPRPPSASSEDEDDVDSGWEG